MGTVLKISADHLLIDDLAEVVAWRLSDERNRLLGANEVIDELYVVGPARAKPTWLLAERLNKYEKLPGIDFIKINEEIVTYSVKRAIQIYCGYWNMNRIYFVNSDSEIKGINVKMVDYIRELNIMRDNKKTLDDSRTFDEDMKKQLSDTFHRSISPEFDRLDVHLGVVEGKVDRIESVGNHSNGILQEHTILLLELRKLLENRMQ